MIDTAADLTAMLADWGKPLTVGATSGVGVLSRNTQILLDDQLVYEGDSVLALAAQCGGLQRGDTLIIDGILFSVIADPILGADGLLCRVPVSGEASTVAATVEDLAILADWGQAITIGGVAGLGVLSTQSQTVLDGEQTHNGRSLLTAATLAASLRYGETIAVGALTYRVQHDPWISADGALCRVPLSGPIAAPPPPPLAFQALTTTTGLVLTTTTGLELAVA